MILFHVETADIYAFGTVKQFANNIHEGLRETLKLFSSRRTFTIAFPSQRQESFFLGHVQAFAFFGGVPQRISYDNLKIAVQKVLRGKQRVEQETFYAVFTCPKHKAIWANNGECGHLYDANGAEFRCSVIDKKRVGGVSIIDGVYKNSAAEIWLLILYNSCRLGREHMRKKTPPPKTGTRETRLEQPGLSLG